MIPIAVAAAARLVKTIADRPDMSGGDWCGLVATIAAAVGVQRACASVAAFGRESFVRGIELAAEASMVTNLAKVDLRCYDDLAWQERLARARRALNGHPGGIVWALVGLGGPLASLGGVSALLATLDARFVAIAAIGALVATIAERRVTAEAFLLNKQKTKEEREREYLVHTFQSATSAMELRVLTASEKLRKRHSDLCASIHATLRDGRSRGTRAAIVSGVVAGVGAGAAYSLAATSDGVSEALGVQSVVVLIGAFGVISGTIVNIASTMTVLSSHMIHLEDYFEFLDASSIGEVTSGRETGRIQSVELRDVSFSHKDARRAALTRVSLEIRTNQVVAIIGESGAGKTTLLEVLLGLRLPSEGQVLINGMDVVGVDRERYRSHAAVLLQDFTRFELQVGEFVTLGPGTDTPNGRSVREALEAASVAELGNGPFGLEQRVGQSDASSRSLSGGEWQRLALARVFYRGCDLWVLDEPTSAMDPIAEARVMEELRRRVSGRVCVLVTHRASTARWADRILVLKEGRVVESGTHSELMESGGEYVKWYRAQVPMSS